MAGEIQALFNKYQQKYPLYTREAIINIMINEGAFEKYIAEGILNRDDVMKIKAGQSLFLFDNKFKSSFEENNINMTKIFGGNFSKKTVKTIPKTNFNRKIEFSNQSKKQADCWLLSGINAMNTTEWGKQAIYDAIIPDQDDSGGVTIKFKGSPLKQKSFHITAEEIDVARKSGKYSDGDDDMIAFELATEKVIKGMLKEGKGTRVDVFDKQIGYKSYLSGLITKENRLSYDTLSVMELITGNKDIRYQWWYKEKGSEKVLKYLSQNTNKTVCTCCFDGWVDREENDPIHGNHAYAIKKIVYGKSVIVIDPDTPRKPITLSWSKFIDECKDLFINYKDKHTLSEIKKSFPEQYEKDLIKYDKKQ